MSSVLLDIAQVGIGEEATENTEVASYSSFPVIVQKDGLKLKTESEELIINDISSINEAEDIKQGLKSYEVEATGKIQSFIFFYWFFGTLTSETGTGPYTHTIDPKVGTLPATSIEAVIGNGDFSLKFLGCKISQIVLTITKDAVPTAKITFVPTSMSIDPTPGTHATASTDIFSIAETSTLDLNSVGYPAECEKAEYTFTQDISPDHGLNSIEPSEVIEGGNRGLSVAYTIRIKDETLIQLWQNDTNIPISHIVQRGGSAQDQITITVNNAKTSAPDVSPKGGGGSQRINLPVKSYGDLQVVIVDSVATYSNPQ